MPWDYDDEAFQKQAQSDPVWYLERLIIYGSGEQKLPRKLLEKHLADLNIPDDHRALLELLVWNKPF